MPVRLEIEGGRPLKGTVAVSAAKNAALPALAAGLLTAEPLVFPNVPALNDVRTMIKLLETLGGRVQRAGSALTQNGFFEHEIGRSIDRFGAIAQVFSAYESKRSASDAKPFARGINSIQLFDDGTRWYVVTIYWDSERPGNPIPEKYLRR